MPNKSKPFANLKQGTFKRYLKSTKKIPLKHRKSTRSAAAYIVRNKDSRFHPRTVKRARLVLLAAKYRNKRKK